MNTNHFTGRGLLKSIVLGCAVFLMMRGQSWSQIISVDFAGDDNNISSYWGDAYGAATTPMGSSEVAGVVAASNWNFFGRIQQSTPVALLDSDGNDSGATVAWYASYGGQTTAADTAGDSRMMRGGLLSIGNTISLNITVSAALAATGYNIILYGDTNSFIGNPPSSSSVTRSFGAIMTNGSGGDKFFEDPARC